MVMLALIGGTTYAQQQPRQATLAQQKTCADQAEKFYNEHEHVTWRTVDPYNYTSHYDPKQNVCFVAYRWVTDVGVSYFVFDAFENILRALLVFDAKSPGVMTQHGIDNRVGACEVNLPGQKTIYCKTAEGWDNLVLKHFGIARYFNTWR
jgi:hypothetical protein